MDLSVQRLERRYLLPADAEAAAPRLDESVAAALEGALDAAARALGLAPTVEVCVRALHVPVDVELGASDADIAGRLTRAFTRSLAEAVRGAPAGTPDVVVFRSRTHALADVMSRAPAGDTRRAWAWAQLGLWPARTVSGERAVLEALAHTLIARADELPRALALLKPEPAAALVVRLGPAILREVTRAVLVQHGQPRAMADAVVAAATAGWTRAALADTEGPTARRAAAQVLRVAWARLLAGRLALTAAGTDASADAARQVLALVTVLALAVEAPELLVTARALPSVVAFTVESLREDSEAPAEARARRAAPSSSRTAAADDVADVPHADGRRAAEWSTEVGGDDTTAAPADALAAADAPGTWTDWGGLPFLLHLLTALDAAAWHAAQPALSARSLRWVLHSLAQALAPVAAKDAGALALAGLEPDAEPPTVSESPANDDEAAAVALLRGEVLERLRAHLARFGVAAPRDDAHLVARVCRRRGCVTLTGRWLEVALALDDVDTDVRRAGLDLDPGWLRWLGLVVRFRYA